MIPFLLIACVSPGSVAPDPVGIVDTDPTVDTEHTDDTDEPTLPLEVNRPPPGPVVCTRPNLQALLDQVATWPHPTSCGHLWFSTLLDNRTLGLQVYIETRDRDLIEGETFSLDFAAPAGAVGSLLIQQGTALQPVCEVAPDTGDDPEPSDTWRAIRGKATYTITSASEEVPGAVNAELAISGVVIDRVGVAVEQCTLPDTTFSDLLLGWYPD